MASPNTPALEDFRIQPSAAMAPLLMGRGPFDTFARAQALEMQGRRILHFELGEPDAPTPAYIKHAGIAAIEADHTHYAPARGLAELRKAIAEHAARLRGIPEFSASEVVVAPGAKSLIWNVMSALLDRGDEVVFADPAYPSYSACANYLGAKTVHVPLIEADAFRIDRERLRNAVSNKTKLLVLNSPHNPTGCVLDRGDLEAIADIAIAHGLTVLADEIYSRIVYDGTFVSISSIDGMRERTVILDGFSKTYAMTGWRLGYGIMPEHLANAVTLLGQNTYSCAATFVQEAGVAALLGPQDCVTRMVDSLRERRDAIVRGLNSLPNVTCATPAGAFYAFANFSQAMPDDIHLASVLLEEGSVAALAGSIFGSAGRGFLRFSYATSIEVIALAIERIEAVLSNLRERNHPLQAASATKNTAGAKR